MAKPPAGLKIFTDEDTEASAWGRILLMGPKGVGKTTSVLTTSPRPVFVLACDDVEDGESNALVSAMREGAKYSGVTVTSLKSWHRAIDYVLDLAEEEKVRTVVVDTLTLLSETLKHEIVAAGAEGFDIFAELKEELISNVRKLMRVNAHLIATTHPLPLDDGIAGVLPAIEGKSKVILPTMFPDFIFMEYEAGKDPERAFLVNPQGDKWKHGSRNARHALRMEANVTELLKELGIEP